VVIRKRSSEYSSVRPVIPSDDRADALHVRPCDGLRILSAGDLDAD
jgi:hypothetical protein